MGTPPPMWTDTQSENITSRHPSDAGGKNVLFAKSRTCCHASKTKFGYFFSLVMGTLAVDSTGGLSIKVFISKCIYT